MSKDECPFCRIARGDADAVVVYQDDRVCAFLDIAPISPGHTLVVPNHHCRDMDELDAETAHAVFDATARVWRALDALYKPDGISVMQNGGVFDDVGHYHMHVFCRFLEDGFGWRFPDATALEPRDQVGARLQERISKG